jgi:hypothetical protein
MPVLIQRLARVPGLLLFILISLAGTADAQTGNCAPVSGSFTIYLSAPSMTPGSRENAQDLLNLLQWELDQHRDNKWVRPTSTDVHFVACPNRVWTPEALEFGSQQIETLYDGRVLLEIWGLLAVETTGGTQPRRSARMNYLLVPIRFAANQSEPAAPSLQRLPYPDQGAAAEDFVQLIAQPRDIDAFVAAALGVKLVREKREYETAYQNLCRASTLLNAITKRPLVGRTRDDLIALRAFVIESAGRAVTEGRAVPNYLRTGTLWLHDPKDPCAGET